MEGIKTHSGTVVPVAFASYGEDGPGEQLFQAVAVYASVSITDEEAREILASIRDGIFALHARSRPVLSDDAIAALLTSLETRYLVGLQDRRPLIARTITDLVFEPLATLFEDGAEYRDLTQRFYKIVLSHVVEHHIAHVQEFDDPFASRTIYKLLDLLQDQLPTDGRLFWAVLDNGPLIVEHWARYRPESFCHVTDSEAGSVALYAHRDFWGRRHRHIEMSCSGASLPPSGTFAYAGSWKRESAGWFGPPVFQGHWKAWRQKRPIERLDACMSPSLQVARLLASTAAYVMENKVRPFARQLGEHYYGPPLFLGELIEDARRPAQVRLSRTAADVPRRETGRVSSVQEERSADTAQSDGRTDDNGVLASRDRLLQKLLSNGLEPGAALLLRVDGMDVDGNGSLFVRSSSGKKPILKMEARDAEDFWTLVRVNQTLDGFLFSHQEGGSTYGRRKMTRKELETRMASFSAA